MKTNGLYALTLGDRRGQSLYSKMFVVSLILALIFAALPAAGALAAPATDQDTIVNRDLERAWKNKLRHLRVQGLFYNNVRLLPADFESPSDLARAHMYLEKYGVALRQANTVVFNHTGFDLEGNVINQKQADKTVRDLALYLHMMRGFREKMEDVERVTRRGA